MNSSFRFVLFSFAPPSPTLPLSLSHSLSYLCPLLSLSLSLLIFFIDPALLSPPPFSLSFPPSFSLALALLSSPLLGLPLSPHFFLIDLALLPPLPPLPPPSPHFSLSTPLSSPLPPPPLSLLLPPHLSSLPFVTPHLSPLPLFRTPHTFRHSLFLPPPPFATPSFYLPPPSFPTTPKPPKIISLSLLLSPHKLLLSPHGLFLFPHGLLPPTHPLSTISHHTTAHQSKSSHIKSNRINPTSPYLSPNHNIPRLLSMPYKLFPRPIRSDPIQSRPLQLNISFLSIRFEKPYTHTPTHTHTQTRRRKRKIEKQATTHKMNNTDEHDLQGLLWLGLAWPGQAWRGVVWRDVTDVIISLGNVRACVRVNSACRMYSACLLADMVTRLCRV